jgi:hypothetical protein
MAWIHYYQDNQYIASYTYVYTVLHSMIPLSFFFAVCIYNTVRTLLWFTVVHLAACQRDDECHVLEIDRWTGESEWILCALLFSFLTAMQNRVDSSGIRNPLYFYFVEANKKNPAADSGFRWNMADSSGFQWNRIDANALLLEPTQ